MRYFSNGLRRIMNAIYQYRRNHCMTICGTEHIELHVELRMDLGDVECDVGLNGLEMLKP